MDRETLAGEGKNRFFRVFANLPLNLRSEVILVIPEGPVTWRVAYLEISNNTQLGNLILQKLLELNVI